MDNKPESDGAAAKPKLGGDAGLSALAEDSAFRTSSTATLTVGSVELSQEIAAVVLEQTVAGHHRLEVDINQEEATDTMDTAFTELSKFTDMLGEAVSLTIEADLVNTPEPERQTFTGIVTEVRLDNSVNELNRVKIVAMSPTIALDGAKLDQFFYDNTPSDILKSVLANYPITVGSVDSAGKQMPFCVQYRETDFDLVLRLAASAGLIAFYDGEKFFATKPSSSQATKLIWRETLGSFALGLGTAQKEYKSAVYNYQKSTTFDRDSKSVPLNASLSDLGKIAANASGKVYTKSGVAPRLTSADDVSSVDDALTIERSGAVGRMVDARGTSLNANIQVGHCIEVTGMAQLDGVYFVQAITHLMDADGYCNTFSCVPIDMAGPQAPATATPQLGLQTALVVDNNDPDQLGRVKIKFPWSRNQETVWVRVAGPHASAGSGWYTMPEVNDEVVVGFEYGSPGLPVIVGALYNKASKLWSQMFNEENNHKVFVTRSGHQLFFSDESGKELVRLVTKDDKNSIVLDVSGPSITITSQGDISMKGANVKIEADQKIEIKSGADMNVTAGANMKQEASANFDIKGSGQVTVKGATINLN